MLFVKRGERVEAEAAALTTAAGHPGVVELVDVDAAAGALRTTLLRDARPLGDTGPLAADELAGVVASVASTLADLHDLGVVHGAIDGSHVLVAADGRPVLCSLGRGGSPAGDVLALATLAGTLLAGRSQSQSPVVHPWRPSSRAPGLLQRRRAGPHGPAGGRRPRRRRRLGPMLAPDPTGALAAVLEDATTTDVDARPTARALAAAIHQRVPTGRLPMPAGRARLPLSAPSGGRAGGRSSQPTAPAPGDPGVVPAPAQMLSGGSGRGATAGWVAAAVGVGAVVVLVLSFVQRGGRQPVEPSPPPAGAAATPPRSAGSPAVPDGAPPPSVAVRVWPEEPLDFRDGVLTLDGARYALGRPGDAVAAGDWACRGGRTLALLRPATGEVFAFDEWPAEGEATTARPLATVAGAKAVRVVDADGDGCDDLELLRPGAEPVRLEPAA